MGAVECRTARADFHAAAGGPVSDITVAAHRGSAAPAGKCAWNEPSDPERVRTGDFHDRVQVREGRGSVRGHRLRNRITAGPKLVRE